MSDTANRLLSLTRRKKQLLVVVADVAMAILATWIAFSIRLDQPYVPAATDAVTIALCVTLFIPVFIRMGLYRAVFRYSGVQAYKTALIATAIYGAILFAIMIIFHPGGSPRSVAIIQPIVFFVLATNMRMLIGEWLQANAAARRWARRETLVYGTDEAAIHLASTLQAGRSFRVVALVSSRPELIGRTILGIPVIPVSSIEEMVESRDIREIMIATDDMQPEERRELIAKMERHTVRVRIMPDYGSILSGQVSALDFREPEIADLIPREINQVAEPFSRVSGKTVLVTGGGGSIGSELCRQLIRLKPAELWIVEQSEHALYLIDQELRRIRQLVDGETEVRPVLADIRNFDRLERVFAEARPFAVFHAAAYKHVPLVEANAVEGIVNNIIGSMNVARLSLEHSVDRSILISTDKAVRPTNVMGASKRVAELIYQAAAEQAGRGNSGKGNSDKRNSGKGASNGGHPVFAMVRFGNVFGSSGSVVPLFRNQIRQGGPVTVTHPEVERFFMTIPEAVNLVLQAAGSADGGEVFLLDMGQSVKIAELARRMIRLSGFTVKTPENPDGDIEIRYTGLRPGEKLYEELLIDASAESTGIRHILKAHEPHLTWADMQKHVAGIASAAQKEDIETLKAILRELVSGYGTPATRSEIRSRQRKKQAAVSAAR